MLASMLDGAADARLRSVLGGILGGCRSLSSVAVVTDLQLPLLKVHGSLGYLLDSRES